MIAACVSGARARKDEELVDLAYEFGEERLSAVVNAALTEHVERLARLAKLRQLLTGGGMD
jgi:hypothetical protein